MFFIVVNLRCLQFILLMLSIVQCVSFHEMLAFLHFTLGIQLHHFFNDMLLQFLPILHIALLVLFVEYGHVP